jgi:SP family sugar:H+ symporter-like MFS transporter
MIYETKGLSLEQVDELYGVVTQAWKSKSFRPQVQFAQIDHEQNRHMSLADVAANQERKRSVQHDEAVLAGAEKV